MKPPKSEQNKDGKTDVPVIENSLSGSFAEYKVQVRSLYENSRSGTRDFIGYEGTLDSRPVAGRTNIVVDRSKIDRLNSKWNNRKLYLIEEGQPVPSMVITKGDETTFVN